MAINMNRITIVGRVGADPEQSGRGPVKFSVATSRYWKGQDGERQEKTEWHRVVVWNTVAQKFALDYIKKGDLVCVEGAMEYRVWEKDEGEKVNLAEVVVHPYGGSVQALSRDGGGREESSRSTGGTAQQRVQDDEDHERRFVGRGGGGGYGRDLDDEIPF